MTTQVARLTPSGASAIAVIAVRGDSAWNLLRAMFRPASDKPLPGHPIENATWLGHLGEGAGDEVILAVTAVTPEPCVEIHCHGGRQVVRWLIDCLRAAGCVEVEPEELLESNAAWRLLPHAMTVRTAAILLDQAQGALDRAQAELAQARIAGRDADAEALMQAIRRYESIGRHLIVPWRVAITGAPNAGKSSLLNALAGYQRSVVAPIPGTTRDVVTVMLALDGWPVEFADTAGLRESGDDFEEEGIQRARKQLADADLCLWVIDATGPEPVAPSAFARDNGIAVERLLPVINKIDLMPGWNLEKLPDAACISAVTGSGIDELIRRIVKTLAPEAPPPGAAVPIASQEERQAGWPGSH